MGGETAEHIRAWSEMTIKSHLLGSFQDDSPTKAFVNFYAADNGFFGQNILQLGVN